MRPPRDTGIETPAGSTPGNSRPGSVEGTPEEGKSSSIYFLHTLTLRQRKLDPFISKSNQCLLPMAHSSWQMPVV
jgi:hypothetical protein